MAEASCSFKKRRPLMLLSTSGGSPSFSLRCRIEGIQYFSRGLLKANQMLNNLHTTANILKAGQTRLMHVYRAEHTQINKIT